MDMSLCQDDYCPYSFSCRHCGQGKIQVPTLACYYISTRDCLQNSKSCVCGYSADKEFPNLRMTDLFARIVEFENPAHRICGARTNKRYRSLILKFGYALEENLLALQRELTHKTYTWRVSWNLLVAD